jgi:quercetin dioxygenase-like cupin family protein
MSSPIYRLTPQQTLTVTKSSADTGGSLLEVETTWTDGGDLPPAHLHPAQDEHFKVLEGQLRALVADSERLLGPGDELHIPRGTVHAMTATEAPTRAIWQTRPALRTEEFFAGMDNVVARGGSLLAYAPVFRAHAPEVRLTKPPTWIQRPLFAVLSAAIQLRRR